MKTRLVSLLMSFIMLIALVPSVGMAQDEPVTITIFGLPATVPDDDPILPVIEQKLNIKIKKTSGIINIHRKPYLMRLE